MFTTAESKKEKKKKGRGESELNSWKGVWVGRRNNKERRKDAVGNKAGDVRMRNSPPLETVLLTNNCKKKWTSSLLKGGTTG